MSAKPPFIKVIIDSRANIRFQDNVCKEEFQNHSQLNYCMTDPQEIDHTALSHSVLKTYKFKDGLRSFFLDEVSLLLFLPIGKASKEDFSWMTGCELCPEVLPSAISQDSARIRFIIDFSGIDEGDLLNKLNKLSKGILVSGGLAEMKQHLLIKIGREVGGFDGSGVAGRPRNAISFAFEFPFYGGGVVDLDDEVDAVSTLSKSAHVVAFAVVNHSLLVVRLSQGQEEQQSQAQQSKRQLHINIFINRKVILQDFKFAPAIITPVMFRAS